MADHAIRIDGFSYTYDDGTAALTDVSFTIRQGESVALVGHNGSGKSTLLMHLVGILGPDERISVYGSPVTSRTLSDVRRRIGYVFQDPRDQLFMTTVADDVAFGPLNAGLSREDAIREVQRALELVGVPGFESRVPYHLSGGEMRRVAIATVLSMSPYTVVMDEPSAGIDPRGTRELAALIRDLTCTRIIASHDLAFARACTNRTILINRGRVVADGPSDVILADERLLVDNGL